MSTSDPIPPPTREPAPTFLMATPRAAWTLAEVTLLLLLCGPFSVADANLIWNWTGDCVTSSPPPVCQHASFEAVTIDAYVPGTRVEFPPASNPILLQGVYLDDTGAAYPSTTLGGFPDFGFSVGNGIALELPAFSGPGVGEVLAEARVFTSAADGTWRFASEGAAPDCTFANPRPPGNVFCGYEARGINGTWTRVPGPSTLALVAIGLVALASLYRLTEEKSSHAWRRLRFRRSSATGT